jgi:hypothetical protein
MGYPLMFDGLGIYMNSVKLSNKKNGNKHQIQGYYNDGTHYANLQKQKGDLCMREFRNLPTEDFYHVGVEYEEPMVSVSTFDLTT